ncbi:LysM peptidoglycan-binding domain-containing protein [Candidatus Saccharibacteria bacterium]|nr:LysM peptidoglycan-binding domain-containing protein [Candidatus Saccharibacteria bacterium]
MTNKKIQPEKTNPVLRAILYAFASLLILGTAYFGSKNKVAEENGVPIMLAISDNNYSVSVDQLSELYIVAEIANNVSLSSSSYLNMDYISAVTQYSINQTASTKIEKTNIVDTSSLAKGVIEYEVGAGESMEDIASSFGLTTDQIRWSNGLKETTLDAGQTIYLPGVSGIVYSVNEGDTVQSIAEKYGSTASEIEEKNNLTARGLSAGAKIVIPNGVVPEKERPEYVAPVTQTYVATTSYSTYYPSTTLYSTSSNPMPYGWCTWYAWQWRADNGSTLPGGLGNARYWAGQLGARGYAVDGNPQYGDVFVSQAGYYGHVGIVTGVNADGSIEITDMNGVAGWGRVGTKTVSQAEWSSWQFVH